MVNRLLYLEPGQLRRAWPFFALYLVLFAALTLADGISLALFVARVGADALPRLQALSAVCVMLSVGWYLHTAERTGGDRVFVAILVGPLLLFAGFWVGLRSGMLDERSLGLLFLARELALALVLLHFGAFLQDYFTRIELIRVMPAIYAGGRVGGIAGGAALEHLSGCVQPIDLLLLLVALLAAGIAGVAWIGRNVAVVEEPAEMAGGPSAGDTRSSAWPAREPVDAADCPTGSLGGFLGFVWRSPLLFWITATTVTLFFCRAGLMLEYGRSFEREFAGDAELARFLGRYAQIALAVSLPFQLLVVGRLVAWVGLRGAQVAYALLIVAAAAGGWGPMTLGAAVFARFVESELRYGLRNPLAQMTVNLFPRQIRTGVRAWSLGFLIPAATIAAALALDFLVRREATAAIAVVTIAAALSYLAASLALATTIAEPRRARIWALRRPARATC
jgi:hypothetical protein